MEENILDKLGDSWSPGKSSTYMNEQTFDDENIKSKNLQYKHPYKIWSGKVTNLILDYINNLKLTKEDILNEKRLNETTSRNVLFQTGNVIYKFDQNFINSLKRECVLPFWESFQRAYVVDDLDIDYIHLIKYSKGGKQLPHEHFAKEDYSFIIYLDNDENGGTLFYTWEGTFTIPSERGRIIIFPSNMVHESLPATNKRVLVGALREIGKKWVIKR